MVGTAYVVSFVFLCMRCSRGSLNKRIYFVPVGCEKPDHVRDGYQGEQGVGGGGGGGGKRGMRPSGLSFLEYGCCR